MKHIYINGIKKRVFYEARMAHGYIELTVGENKPTEAHNVPASWWYGDQNVRVYTSGKWYSHNAPKPGTNFEPPNKL